MKNRSWIEMAAVLCLALAAPAALGQESPSAPPPAPALEAPPAPALETPLPAEDTPSPLLNPDTPAPAVTIRPAVTPPAAKPQPPQAPAAEPRTLVTTAIAGHGVIKEDRVNLRSRPYFNSEVVAQLNQGDPIEVMEQIKVENPKPGEPAEWIKIGLPTTNYVWLSSKFVDPATRTVTAARLNVRAGPGENHAVLGRISKGDPVHEVEAQGEWLRIPAPPGAYAFVASFLVDRKGTERTGALAQVAPAQVQLPRASPTAVEPAGPVVEPAPAVTEVRPAVAGVEPAVAEPAVAEPAVVEQTQVALLEPEPTPEEPRLVKRIVSREGFVRRSVSIQAPTEFVLENVETRKTVNYLYMPRGSDIVLRNFEGQRILVTGEELLDERWPNTPVMNIEKLRARP